MPARYELMYIIPATLTDEEVGAVETKVSALLSKLGASIETTKRLGKFRFTYPIKNQRHGNYVLMILQIEPSAVAKIEENLRITSDVLRHLIVRTDQALADQRFDLIQFTEVNIEQRDERPRHRERPEAVKEAIAKADETIKAGVSVLEGVVAVPVSAPMEGDFSSEDLDKKIETALNADVKDL